ncbi:glyoxalase [Lewinellaceae bacterium SD302]|nr:glyoxalase [Lewinellaceae bacterium SD302]
MKRLMPFHLAVPVDDIAKAREFYGDVLGCPEGRSAPHWVDFDLYGHQFVVHYRPKPDYEESVVYSKVDDHDVPIPHFGIVLEWEDWQQLSKRLIAAETEFVIEPYIRFKGLAGEQATMFFFDPSGNALEFKAFKDISQLFAK